MFGGRALHGGSSGAAEPVRQHRIIKNECVYCGDDMRMEK